MPDRRACECTFLPALGMCIYTSSFSPLRHTGIALAIWSLAQKWGSDIEEMNVIVKKTEGSDEQDIGGKKRDRARIGRTGPGRENAGTGEQDPGRKTEGSEEQDLGGKTRDRANRTWEGKQKDWTNGTWEGKCGIR